MGKKVDLSIAIPYHGDRSKWTMQTILNVHNMNFVREIVIVVEAGNEEEILKLGKMTKNYPKVYIHKNDSRLFVFRNKIRAVSSCEGEYVALIDSDNIIGTTYLAPILRAIKDPRIIYCPEQGFPSLDYKKFSGLDIGLTEATALIGDKQYDMLINTMNYIFHRDTWLKALSEAIVSDYEPMTADSAWINFNCLKNGMTLNVVKGSSYKHTVHNQSTYLLHQSEGVDNYAKICQQMKELRNEDLGSSRTIQARKSRYLSKTSNYSATGGQSRTVVQSSPEGDTNKSGLLSD